MILKTAEHPPPNAVHPQSNEGFDIVVSLKGECVAVVECKAPTVTLSENALFQAAAYNSVLQATYIVLFNGENQLVCKKEQGTYLLCEQLPCFSEMMKNIVWLEK